MSDVYTTKLLSEQVHLTAHEIIRDHGDDAFHVAQKQISACNARGDFSAAETWVIICRQIRELQQDAPGAPAE